MMKTEETARALPRSPDWKGLGQKRPANGRWVARAPRLRRGTAVTQALAKATAIAQSGEQKRKPWKLIRTVRKALRWDK